MHARNVHRRPPVRPRRRVVVACREKRKGAKPGARSFVLAAAAPRALRRAPLPARRVRVRLQRLDGVREPAVRVLELLELVLPARLAPDVEALEADADPAAGGEWRAAKRARSGDSEDD
jgi:hypothetical protein